MTEISAITSDPWLELQQGTNVASERLMRALEAYASAEMHDLADCQDLARRTDEPSVKLLLSLIIDDEHRHQALLASMVRHLQGDSLQVDSTQPGGLDGDVPQLPEAEFAAVLRTLIRDEHEGARHLRHVGRQEGAICGGLFTLLLETIARDSEKHATILRYLLARVERRPERRPCDP